MKAAFASVAIVALAAAAIFGWLWQRAYGPWPQWEAYAVHFVQNDGRVIDLTADSRSTSEGQAYSLFFALVANDRPRFDRILDWTRDNLCGGDFATRLPAWLWGDKGDGSWGVIDDNSASDADLWLAYTLLQAGRVWQQPGFDKTGRQLLVQIESRELAEVGSVGLLLLPAPKGFALDDGNWRLNPSYYARFQLDGLATADPAGPWQKVRQNYERLLPQIAPHGLAPDWVVIDGNGQAVADDSAASDIGSYDAIRVYLWAGLSALADPVAPSRYLAYADLFRLSGGTPPEVVHVDTAEIGGTSPAGFSGAVLPWLKALGMNVAVANQERALQSHRESDGLLGNPAHYYDQVLALFGEGWISKRYRFERDGRMTLRWESLWFGL